MVIMTYAILGSNLVMIMTLHLLENKGMNIEWEWVTLGIGLQVIFGLLKLFEKLQVFLF